MKPVSELPAKKPSQVPAQASPQAIRYRLYHVHGGGSNRYQIRVQYLNEQACATFYADSPHLAGQIYRKIVNGKVTPCTLLDIVQDLTS